MQTAVGTATGEQQMVREEEHLADNLFPGFLEAAKAAACRRVLAVAVEHLDQSSLSDERLVHVQQNVAAFDDQPLDRQILPDVLRFAHFIVHNLKANKHNGSDLNDVNTSIVKSGDENRRQEKKKQSGGTLGGRTRLKMETNVERSTRRFDGTTARRSVAVAT